MKRAGSVLSKGQKFLSSPDFKNVFRPPLASNHPKIKGISTSAPLGENSNYSSNYYFNMDSQHLGAGFQCPPLEKTNKLRIYSMRFCPYAQRAILVALAKGIPHDVVNCNLKDKAEWLLQRNPYGKVPVVEFPNGNILFESLVVAEYFDDAYQSRPLSSPDPYQKALDRLWVERFNKTISSFYRVVFAIRNGDVEKLNKYAESFEASFMTFECELERRGTAFFGGNNYPGFLDYMIWPWVERLPAFKAIIPEQYYSTSLSKLATGCKSLDDWQSRMKEDFAVKEFLLPVEIHKKFMESFISGSPNYNILESKL